MHCRLLGHLPGARLIMSMHECNSNQATENIESLCSLVDAPQWPVQVMVLLLWLRGAAIHVWKNSLPYSIWSHSRLTFFGTFIPSDSLHPLPSNPGTEDAFSSQKADASRVEESNASLSISGRFLDIIHMADSNYIFAPSSCQSNSLATYLAVA